jgi:hypothetical protein
MEKGRKKREGLKTAADVATVVLALIELARFVLEKLIK